MNLNNWIEIKNKKPKKGKVVYIYGPEYNRGAGVFEDCDSGEIFFDYINHDYGGSIARKDVTHWMEMPEEPNGDESLMDIIITFFNDMEESYGYDDPSELLNKALAQGGLAQQLHKDLKKYLKN